MVSLSPLGNRVGTLPIWGALPVAEVSPPLGLSVSPERGFLSPAWMVGSVVCGQLPVFWEGGRGGGGLMGWGRLGCHRSSSDSKPALFSVHYCVALQILVSLLIPERHRRPHTQWTSSSLALQREMPLVRLPSCLFAFPAVQNCVEYF